MKSLLFLFLLIFTGALYGSSNSLYYPNETLKKEFSFIFNSPLNEALKSPLVLHSSLIKESYAIIVSREDIPKAQRDKLTSLGEFEKLHYWLIQLSENDHYKKMIVESFKLKKTKKTTLNVLEKIFPTAYASDCESGTIISRSNLKPASSFISESNLTDKVMECGKGVLQGAWDATGGIVVDGAKFIYNLITSPKETIAKTKKQFKAMLGMIKNFKQTLKDFSNFFKSLDANSKAHLICSFIGSVGTDALIAVLTLGAGSAKLILSFTRYLQRFSKIARLANHFARLKKFSTGIPKEFLQKLARNKVPEDILETIDIFARNDMMKFAGSTVQCAI